MYLAFFYFKQVGSCTLSKFKIWHSSSPLPDYVQFFSWLCVLDLPEKNETFCVALIVAAVKLVSLGCD